MPKSLPALLSTAAALCLFPAVIATADVVEVEGKIESPADTYGNNADFRLKADTTFGWRTRRIGDLDVAGHRFIMNTGGGNPVHVVGALTGSGTILWQGGGDRSDRWASFLEGDSPNTFTGTFAQERGLIVLRKPAGVTAIAGPLTLGQTQWAGIRWESSDQVADDAPITVAGRHGATFELRGARETLGALNLQGDAEIILSEGDNILKFVNSRDSTWRPGAQLIVRGWDDGSQAGGDEVSFGSGADGLTKAQVAQVGFVDPAGHDAGLYRARMLPTGALAPGEPVQPVNPPYDLSSDARQQRENLYATDGLEALAAAAKKLDRNITVSVFGDSITWLGGYLKILTAAVSSDGEGEPRVTFINRGINGGGARHLLHGADGLFKQDQPPLPEVLDKDQPQIAVFFIGVNDVNVFNTDPLEFRESLTQLIRTAQARGITPIVATLMLVNEKPDGTNPKDSALDGFARITLEVAEQMDVAAIDLRSISLAYLKNHNYEVHLDGSVHHRTQGILTGDGIHPTAEGNRLIAGHLAAAIAEALSD